MKFISSVFSMLAMSLVALFPSAFKIFKIRNNQISTSKIFKLRMSSVLPKAEFSRIIHVDQIPEKRPVLCKLLAKETERRNLAERFDIPKLELFSANITLRRRDGVSIVVEGSIEAHIRFGEQLDIEKISNSFDTLLLNNFGRSSSVSSLNLDDETDYDDEVDSNGNIDIGEIAAQYLALELY